MFVDYPSAKRQVSILLTRRVLRTGGRLFLGVPLAQVMFGWTKFLAPQKVGTTAMGKARPVPVISLCRRVLLQWSVMLLSDGLTPFRKLILGRVSTRR